jgi:hypothetical protein
LDGDAAATAAAAAADGTEAGAAAGASGGEDVTGASWNTLAGATRSREGTGRERCDGCS